MQEPSTHAVEHPGKILRSQPAFVVIRYNADLLDSYPKPWDAVMRNEHNQQCNVDNPCQIEVAPDFVT